MRVLITGVSSFIGSNLGAYLHEKGCTVCGTVRSERYEYFRPSWLHKSLQMDLHDVAGKHDSSIFEGVTTVIHLAHDFRENTVEMNIRATEWLAEHAAKSGVSRQIFFSSYSARPDAVSEYGIIKYRLEQYFLGRGHSIIRPGLVIGNGGMFLTFFQSIKRFPVIPLPDGGKGEVPIISIRQLCEVTHKIISLPTLSGSEFNLFYPDMTTMKTLVDAIKSVAGSRAVILPLPSVMLLWAVYAGKALGITLPFNVDSLRSFRKNQQRIHCSNIETFLNGCDSVQDAVQAAFQPTDA